ncbi:hypothetical protein K438DRAFT_1819149 [Mycena galopus ATCC 62051]|nr:hypothetical protein K438DRAFT_1819149 [Mycena galopus ATCC 62051]
MQVTKGKALLAKYNLKANDAILANAKHDPMFIGFFCSSNHLNKSAAMLSWSKSTR